MSDWHAWSTFDPGQSSVITLTWPKHHLDRIYVVDRPTQLLSFGFLVVDIQRKEEIAGQSARIYAAAPHWIYGD